MMRKMMVLGATLILSLVFCSVSEAVNLKNGIIGKWVKEDSKGSYEFLKDGTAIMVIVHDGVFLETASGNYKFIDENRIKIDVGGIGSKVFEVSIDKQGQLILTDPAGRVDKYITKAEKEKRIAWEKRNEKLIKERFTFADLTVLDNKTKLMWTRDGNIADRMTWNDAFKFIESLNQQKYAGYSDWRLPSKEEIQAITYLGGEGRVPINLPKYFNKFGFENVVYHYWSSSTSAGNTTDAWSVGMDNSVFTVSKTITFYVWPVRAGVASSSAPSKLPPPTPPTMPSTSPANNATGVATNTGVTARFSEAMDASTITTATFTIAGITGTVTYSGTTATFTPSSNLAYNTTYTATITTGVRDTSGNAMASNYSWNFTTRE